MNMLVDLEGAAMAWVGATAAGATAARAEGPAHAEKGVRVKVAFSHFQTCLGWQQRAPQQAPCGCCRSASGWPTPLVRHLPGCVSSGARRPVAVPAVWVPAVMHAAPPAALWPPAGGACVVRHVACASRA